MNAYRSVSKHNPHNTGTDQSVHGNRSSSVSPDQIPTRKELNDDFAQKMDEAGNPDYEDDPELTTRLLNEAMEKKRKARSDVMRLVSDGEMSAQESEDRYDLGLQEGEVKDWGKLPDTLYHVTTAADKVKNEGLKTRRELGQAYGKGLGGGSSATISFTDDLEIAKGIEQAMLEAREVALNEKTTKDMVKEAIEGEFFETLKEWKRIDPTVTLQDIEAYIDNPLRFVDDQRIGAENLFALTGVKVQRPYGIVNELREGYAYVPGQEEEGWQYKKESEAAADEARFNFYKYFSGAREKTTGRLDPLFSSSDVQGLKKIPKDQIALQEFKPANAKKQGHKVSALGEWRTMFGDVTDYVRTIKSDEDDSQQKSFMKSGDTYQPPQGARGNAQKVLDWKKEHGDDVKGMTQVGWTRARQLASGDAVSADIVKRMASFNRHRKNSTVSDEHVNEPWKDRGYVAWLGWGGDSGINWAKDTSSSMNKSVILLPRADNNFRASLLLQAKPIDLRSFMKSQALPYDLPAQDKHTPGGISHDQKKHGNRSDNLTSDRSQAATTSGPFKEGGVIDPVTGDIKYFTKTEIDHNRYFVDQLGYKGGIRDAVADNWITMRKRVDEKLNGPRPVWVVRMGSLENGLRDMQRWMRTLPEEDRSALVQLYVLSKNSNELPKQFMRNTVQEHIDGDVKFGRTSEFRSLQKHTPGGHGHDQKRHGRRSGGLQSSGTREERFASAKERTNTESYELGYTPRDFVPYEPVGESTQNSDFIDYPTDDEVIEYLAGPKKEKTKAIIEDGAEVGLRIDIPAYENHGEYVVSIHAKGTARSVGRPIKYANVARVKNPVLWNTEDTAAQIADGMGKTTAATVRGQFVNDKTIPVDINEWTPVGFNPQHAVFYYDKRTGQEVIGGDEAISIGNTVFIKKPMYSDRNTLASPFVLRGITKKQFDRIDKTMTRLRERGKLTAPRNKHYGDGAHPGTGTPQSVHGGGGSSESQSTTKLKPEDTESIAGMEHLQRKILGSNADGITQLQQTYEAQEKWNHSQAITLLWEAKDESNSMNIDQLEKKRDSIKNDGDEFMQWKAGFFDQIIGSRRAYGPEATTGITTLKPALDSRTNKQLRELVSEFADQEYETLDDLFSDMGAIQVAAKMVDIKTIPDLFIEQETENYSEYLNGKSDDAWLNEHEDFVNRLDENLEFQMVDVAGVADDRLNYVLDQAGIFGVNRTMIKTDLYKTLTDSEFAQKFADEDLEYLDEVLTKDDLKQFVDRNANLSEEDKGSAFGALDEAYRKGIFDIEIDYAKAFEDAKDEQIEADLEDYLNGEGIEQSWNNTATEDKIYYAGGDRIDTIYEEPSTAFISPSGRGNLSSDVAARARLATVAINRRMNEIVANRSDGFLASELKESQDELWSEWISSSAGAGGRRLQAAAKELGAKGREVSGSYATPLPKADPQDVEALRATYLTSQKVLEHAGIEYLDLYRGMKLNRDQISKVQYDELDQADDVGFVPSMLQSATTDLEVAEKFGSKGIVVRMRVPRELIVAVPSFGDNEHEEEEYVVMGGDWLDYEIYDKDNVPPFEAVAMEDDENFRRPQTKAVASNNAMFEIVVPPYSFSEERRKEKQRQRRLKRLQRLLKHKYDVAKLLGLTSDQFEKSLKKTLFSVLKHDGPDAHSGTGTSQKVHGRRGAAGNRGVQSAFERREKLADRAQQDAEAVAFYLQSLPTLPSSGLSTQRLAETAINNYGERKPKTLEQLRADKDFPAIFTQSGASSSDIKRAMDRITRASQEDIVNEDIQEILLDYYVDQISSGRLSKEQNLGLQHLLGTLKPAGVRGEKYFFKDQFNTILNNTTPQEYSDIGLFEHALTTDQKMVGQAKSDLGVLINTRDFMRENLDQIVDAFGDPTPALRESIQNRVVTNFERDLSAFQGDSKLSVLQRDILFSELRKTRLTEQDIKHLSTSIFGNTTMLPSEPGSIRDLVAGKLNSNEPISAAMLLAYKTAIQREVRDNPTSVVYPVLYQSLLQRDNEGVAELSAQFDVSIDDTRSLSKERMTAAMQDYVGMFIRTQGAEEFATQEVLDRYKDIRVESSLADKKGLTGKIVEAKDPNVRTSFPPEYLVVSDDGLGSMSVYDLDEPFEGVLTIDYDESWTFTESERVLHPSDSTPEQIGLVQEYPEWQMERLLSDEDALLDSDFYEAWKYEQISDDPQGFAERMGYTEDDWNTIDDLMMAADNDSGMYQDLKYTFTQNGPSDEIAEQLRNAIMIVKQDKLQKESTGIDLPSYDDVRERQKLSFFANAQVVKNHFDKVVPAHSQELFDFPAAVAGEESLPLDYEEFQKIQEMASDPDEKAKLKVVNFLRSRQFYPELREIMERDDLSTEQERYIYSLHNEMLDSQPNDVKLNNDQYRVYFELPDVGDEIVYRDKDTKLLQSGMFVGSIKDRMNRNFDTSYVFDEETQTVKPIRTLDNAPNQFIKQKDVEIVKSLIRAQSSILTNDDSNIDVFGTQIAVGAIDDQIISQGLKRELADKILSDRFDEFIEQDSDEIAAQLHEADAANFNRAFTASDNQNNDEFQRPDRQQRERFDIFLRETQTALINETDQVADGKYYANFPFFAQYVKPAIENENLAEGMEKYLDLAKEDILAAGKVFRTTDIDKERYKPSILLQPRANSGVDEGIFAYKVATAAYVDALEEAGETDNFVYYRLRNNLEMFGYESSNPNESFVETIYSQPSSITQINALNGFDKRLRSMSDDELRKSIDSYKARQANIQTFESLVSASHKGLPPVSDYINRRYASALIKESKAREKVRQVLSNVTPATSFRSASQDQGSLEFVGAPVFSAEFEKARYMTTDQLKENFEFLGEQFGVNDQDIQMQMYKHIVKEREASPDVLELIQVSPDLQNSYVAPEARRVYETFVEGLKAKDDSELRREYEFARDFNGEDGERFSTSSELDMDGMNLATNAIFDEIEQRDGFDTGDFGGRPRNQEAFDTAFPRPFADRQFDAYSTTALREYANKTTSPQAYRFAIAELRRRAAETAQTTPSVVRPAPAPGQMTFNNPDFFNKKQRRKKKEERRRKNLERRMLGKEVVIDGRTSTWETEGDEFSATLSGGGSSLAGLNDIDSELAADMVDGDTGGYSYSFSDSTNSYSMTGASDGDKSYATDVIRGAATSFVKLIEEKNPGYVNYTSSGAGRSGLYKMLTANAHIMIPGYTGVVVSETRDDVPTTDSDGNPVTRENQVVEGSYGVIRTDLVLFLKEVAKGEGEQAQRIRERLESLEFLEEGLFEDEE